MAEKSARAVFMILLLAGVIVLPAVTGMPTPLPPGLTTRAPITIASDADFTAANGVVSGSGTPSDPFVIAGWHVRASASAGIIVRDVTQAFVVRDNLVEASGTSAGIVVERASGSAVVQNNQVRVHQGSGLRFESTAAVARDNTVQGASVAAGAGVIAASFRGALVENVIATVATAIQITGGAPLIEGNNVGVTGDGILVSDVAVGSSVTGNVIANVAGTGIRVTRATLTNVTSNLVEHVDVGLDFSSCVEVRARLNDVHATKSVGARVTACNLTMEQNLVADGLVGVTLTGSDVRFNNNTVRNHLDVGVTFRDTEGFAHGNTVQLNGGGIRLTDAMVVKLTGNVLEDNTWGLDIPYAARQSIPYLAGNFVNGLNVDGAVNPAEKAWFYKDANVRVEDVVLDSGFSAGYYGAMSVQGGVVLYEVDAAVVTNATIGHQRVGVHAVNAFNVQVEDSHLVSNVEGVVLTVLDAGVDVPTCVGFVKNSTIEIPVDPPGTVGVRVEAPCHAGVFNNTIRLVDVGVTFSAGATGEIVGNEITLTTDVGINVTGDANEANDLVIVAHNNVTGGRTGARLHGSGSTWVNNSITGNSRIGIELRAGAHPVLRGNNVSLNAHGVIDVDACSATRPSCARVELIAENTFYANAGAGVKLNAGAKFVDNRFIANGDVGVEARGTIHFQGNVAAGTRMGSGAVLEGAVTIWDSSFRANAKNGLVIRGDGQIRDSEFVLNAEAGMRMYTRMVTAFRVNVSGNFDGIVIQEELPEVTVTPPAIPGGPGAPTPPENPGGGIMINPGALIPPMDGVGSWRPRLFEPDPLFLHRSLITMNERNAIRAGAAVVNASYNYWGNAMGPGRDTGATGQFGNTVSPHVHTFPWYTDPQMMTTGPVPGL